MKDDLPIKGNIVIQSHELEVTSSRSGGPGGQHVNKTDSRITVRWNVQNTSALNDEQKKWILQKLASQLTGDGDLIVHASESRSQPQNKVAAFARLAAVVRNALVVPKKRMATRVPKKAKEVRLESKARRSTIKKIRSKKYHED
jgi:ribosome-associated protein